jgi:hypothetical protein
LVDVICGSKVLIEFWLMAIPLMFSSSAILYTFTENFCPLVTSDMINAGILQLSQEAKLISERHIPEAEEFVCQFLVLVFKRETKNIGLTYRLGIELTTSKECPRICQLVIHSAIPILAQIRSKLPEMHRFLVKVCLSSLRNATKQLLLSHPMAGLEYKYQHLLETGILAEDGSCASSSACHGVPRGLSFDAIHQPVQCGKAARQSFLEGLIQSNQGQSSPAELFYV